MTEQVETLTTLKGLTSLGGGITMTVIVCYVIVKYIIPFLERSLDKILKENRDSLTSVIGTYDKFVDKIAETMQKGLATLSEDIRDLRNDLRDDIKDCMKGE